MHRAFYQARPDAGAVVHLHSTMATAVACLADVDTANPIPPLTPYFVMRVGRTMPVVPYYRPGAPVLPGNRLLLPQTPCPVIPGRPSHRSATSSQPTMRRFGRSRAPVRPLIQVGPRPALPGCHARRTLTRAANSSSLESPRHFERDNNTTFTNLEAHKRFALTRGLAATSRRVAKCPCCGAKRPLARIC